MRRVLKELIITTTFLWSFSGFANTEPHIEILGKTMTQAKQQQMTPQQALQRLKEGNQRFLENKTITRDYLKQAYQSSYGQYPFAVVLNCMDSRSVPEFFFDQGLADLFTLRVAGNVLNDDILGSMEFATKAAGARLIVVLAHSSCGAVAGACEGIKLGHLTEVFNKIEPVVPLVMKELNTTNCEDPKLVDSIAKANAFKVVKEIPERSPLLKGLLENKQIGIVAGLHDIKTGQVTFFEEARSL